MRNNQKNKLIRNLFILTWLLVGFVCISSITVSGQEIPIGAWRTHFSYSSAKVVTSTSDRIYCASSYGLFFIDLDDNSINLFNKVDGLSDVAISAMSFSENLNTLVIGYESGLIDLVQENEIITIDLIARQNITESKSIEQITIHESIAYLSTDFGIVVLDLINNSLKEVLREIGPNGDILQVFETTIFNGHLYAVTDQGTQRGEISASINLLDFNNWEQVETPNDLVFNTITQGGGLIYLAESENLYTYDGVSFTNLETTISDIFRLKFFSGSLYILSQSEIGVYINSSFNTLSYPEATPNDILEFSSNIWVADENQGLLNENGGEFIRFAPSGPSTDNLQRLRIDEEVVYGFGPFRSGSYRPIINPTFNIFQLGDWRESAMIDGASDIDGDFIASFSSGLFQISTENILDDNSSGVPISESIQGDGTIISAVKETQTGTWFTNFDTESSLLLLDNNGNWESYDINFQYPVSIEVSANQSVVLGSAPSNPDGLVVFDPINESPQYLNTSNSQLPSNVIYDLDIDQDDELWMATSKGIAYLPSASSDLFSGFNEVIIPVFENRFLFQDEVINCVEVDPGNRKWVGTRAGAWLFEEAAQSLVHHFTISNSPLPSNNVLDIAINETTGEVYILTDKGLVSYRGDATKSEPFHSEVRIFPNPVYPHYAGFVGIDGLATDIRVKITDVSGKLVREIEANGGGLSWDLKDYNGAKADSGVYLFFSSNQTGDETYIGKLLIIN